MSSLSSKLKKSLIALAATGLFAGSSVAMAATPATSPQAANFKFPKNFMWGVSSAGYQYEGYDKPSNWTNYERQGVKEGKMQPHKNAADFFHRYPEDIGLAKKMGLKVFRFSVEWSRVEPVPGKFDPAGLQFYDRVFQTIIANHMRPMVTLDHWVYPEWEYKRGGWNDPQMVNNWVRHAKKLVDRYQKYNPLWITFNEPLFYVAQEVMHGTLKPQNFGAMADKLVTAHNQIYNYIHQKNPQAMVTSNAAYKSSIEPAANIFFLDKVRDHLDFIGWDYYNDITSPQFAISLINTTLSGKDFQKNRDVPSNAKGIYYTAKYYAKRFPNLPQYVVENGTPTNNGAPRADGLTRGKNLENSVYWLQRARSEGVNIIGYNQWSITDNYEWGNYDPRFGLYQVNVLTDPTLRRIPTTGVAAYRKVVANNGMDITYQPTNAEVYCPQWLADNNPELCPQLMFN